MSHAISDVGDHSIEVGVNRHLAGPENRPVPARPNGYLLIALDGTQYHASNSIHCEHCTVKQHRNGQTSYSHTVITPVIVKPGHHQVVPLEPEFITPQDGHGKQDCESAAAKRWISHYATRYKHLGVTLLGDDLYSRQPLCEAVLGAKLNFLFVCKPQSHQTLYEYLDALQDTPTVQTVNVKRRKGKRVETDTYRFALQLPLRDSDDALNVNGCELTTTRADGAVSVTVRSCRYFGPEVAAARRSVRPVPDRACGSASVRANRVAMRFQCPTPFLTLAITPLRSASIAIWQALRTAPYRHDRTVTGELPECLHHQSPDPCKDGHGLGRGRAGPLENRERKQ